MQFLFEMMGVFQVMDNFAINSRGELITFSFPRNNVKEGINDLEL